MRKMMIILSICSFCFMFVGCSSGSTASSNDDVGNKNSIESGLQEMGNQLSDIELIEDNWPDRIGRENENTTAKNLSFEIQISNPMVLAVTCVTENGRLDMEIESDDGEKIFSESDIQTENFDVNINAAGTYKVIIQAEKHTGSFWIEPQK